MSDYVTLDVQVIRQERPAAIQVLIRNGPIWWLPRSQVRNGYELRAGQRNIRIRAMAWIMEQKEKESGGDFDGDTMSR